MLSDAEALHRQETQEKSALDRELEVLRNKLLQEINKLMEHQAKEYKTWEQQITDAIWFNEFFKKF
jgi:hypothetical protein